MSLGVLNNIAAIYAQNNLNQTQSSLQNTLTQLSSGSRINSGADDAAGLAVADGLGANVAALTQSSQNASDGIGLLQTADGALSQVTNLLNRAVTLSTEAANGTLNSNQVSSANQEYQNILSEIGNIGNTTNFNGNSVFTAAAKTVFVSDGTSSGANVYSDVVGALTAGSVGETVGSAGTAASSAGITTADVTANTAASATTSYLTASTSTAGAVASLNFGAATDTVSGSISVGYGGNGAITTVFAAGTSISNAVQQLNTQYTNASSSLHATVSNDGKNITIAGPKDDTAADNGTNDITFTASSLTDTTPATQGTTGAGVDLTASTVSSLSAATAQTVLTTVTSAIGAVAYQRGIIGADINELTAASNVASSESENLTSAQSNIESTNYGQATSDLAKYQVLSQTGISALAQANSVQQEVLKLLQ